jgi:hypothetical protein
MSSLSVVVVAVQLAMVVAVVLVASQFQMATQ